MARAVTDSSATQRGHRVSVPQTGGGRRGGVRAGLRAVLAAAVVGALWVLVVAKVATMPLRIPQLPEAQAKPALYQAATEAYRTGRWDQARRGFEALLQEDPDHARALDYLDRLNTIALESERLARAEEAMVGGRVETAFAQAASVPPHSPLFAQAEALMRGLRDPPAEPLGEIVGVDVESVLQQAVALYTAGRFREATQRAQELAAEAEGEARERLLAWARRCARFGALYESIPGEGALGGTWLAKATQALAWDKELGGAYARVLRPRVVEAYRGLTGDAWAAGQREEACARWVEGREWESREAEWGIWPERCRSAAIQRLRTARSRERLDARQAAALYKQVTQMVPTSSETYEQARARLQALTRRGVPPGNK